MLSIDLNCDMGEGMPNDALLMPLISSASIACGGHAGDTDTMRRTVELALQHNVAIGAHPSYADRENFGRKDLMNLSLLPEDVTALIIDQVVPLVSICAEFGTSLHHIKPHGALYNRAAKDSQVSAAICEAIRQIDSTLFLYGLSGSTMQTQADAYNLKFVREVFADRSYQDDGSLTPRTDPRALIENDKQALEQVIQLIKQGFVISVTGKKVFVQAETFCLHGDAPKAVDFARLINNALAAENIPIGPPLNIK